MSGVREYKQSIRPFETSITKIFPNMPGISSYQQVASCQFGITNWDLGEVESKKSYIPQQYEPTKLVMSCEIDLRCNINEPTDPFLTSTSQIVLHGGKRKNAWHLDQHQLAKNTSKHPHPRFHLENGGYVMKGIASNSVLIVSEPRIMQPPMDLFLFVDFVVSNFFPSKWGQLKENNIYKNRVAKSQKEFWAPFFEALSNHWNTPHRNQKDCPCEELIPQILPVP